MTEPEDRARFLREYRDGWYGLSVVDARRAVEIADERFNGDLHLGAWWIHANSLAVNVKGDRAAWNDKHARSRRGDEAA